MSKYRNDISIYKANQKNTGSAAQVKIAGNNSCLFLECAKQIAPMDSEKPYDWENKIIVKLGLPDISKILAYLRLNAPPVPLKLYHESPDGGNKAMEFKYQEYNGRPGYFLSVSAQKEKGAETKKINIPVGMDEAEILTIGLRRAVELILGW